MKALSTSILGLAFVLPFAGGCAARTAPFNELDQAQVTVLKLQAQPPAPTIPGLPGFGGGGFPTLPIPGFSADQQQQVQGAIQQGVQQLGQFGQQMVPGFQIPGFPMQQPGQQQPGQSQGNFNGFTIMGQNQVADEGLRGELLDIFGNSSNFNSNVGPCFTPGMGVVFADPRLGNIQLMVSFSCNQVQGNGFRWPYAANGLTPDASNRLRNVYQQMFMQAPPQQGS